MKIITHRHLVFLGLAAAVLVAASPVFAQSASPGLVKEVMESWQRTAKEIIDIAEVMPEEKYGFKPPDAELRTFQDHLAHAAAIAQRFIDTAKGTKSEGPSHKAMTKAETIALLKQTFQTVQETLGTFTDAQMLEPVKFPFGNRMVTRVTFWHGPFYQIRNHHGQLVVYLRMNGIVPPATARRPS